MIGFPELEDRPMRRLTPILILGGLLAVPALPTFAEQVFNTYTGKWESVAPGSVLHQNQYTNSWEYGPPDAKPQLNPMTNKWEIAPPGAVPTFDPTTNSWSLQLPGTAREYNPHTGKEEFVQ